MLNETCDFDQPFGFTIIHYICTGLSIPSYALSFYTLIFKSPSHFNKYRNYLVAHILSGLLLEIHMGAIWKVTVVLPIPIMCSNSFTAEYAPIVFQFLPACLVYTGVSIVLLFIYRMEAVAVHRADMIYYRRKLVHVSKRVFYFIVVLLLALSVLIYPDLKYQKEYKEKMEKRFGVFKSYMWCDNCFFFNFDSILFKSFYVTGALTATIGSFSAGLAFHVTVRTLKSVRSSLSPKTAAIQQNFMISLVVMAAIHGICILLPLLGLLWAISIVITLSQLPYLPYLLVLIIQEHGALSTITMFLTNDLLRRTLIKMFSKKPMESLNQSENNRSTIA
ncbi:CRE-SRH-5 protein [Caenorhabditis remanei]|uniref:CRE-SRH-5 protein n=1 Tax=Caenorhabditis remanei TaxID=31234 RepID=E3LLE9_CAERE|nr:CRE-SRH-5 protein [Caenorhabditis remanei]